MDYKGVAKKITRTLFISQSVVAAGLITTGTVNAIVGAELSGVIAWAGVPSTVLLVAAAIGALAWGLVMERAGRRVGLISGMVLGVFGAVAAGASIWIGSFALFLVGMALFGLAQSAMLLGRFAAAEVHPPEERGRAIASVVLGGTVGAILGPQLVSPAGSIASNAGLNELIGPYGTAFLLFILANFIIFYWLRPDPMQVARALSQDELEQGVGTGIVRSISEILQQPAVIVSILSMVIGQVVMVMVMVITSLHMKGLEHSLGEISLVISSHTFGMFAFSIVSGRLADRFGREPVIMLGALILIVAGLSAGLSPEVLPIAVALFLLGLGWNLCYVGGSTLLTDQLSTAEQSRMQGINDLFVGLASATGSLGSGFVFAAVGYQTMGFVGAAFATIPLALALWWTRRHTRLSPA